MGDIEAVKEIIENYAKGCNTGDFDLWMSLWADDGIQMPPNTPMRIGKEQIREGMKPLFDQFNLKIEVDLFAEPVWIFIIKQFRNDRFSRSLRPNKRSADKQRKKMH